jgi:hypothetical protein
MGPLTAELEKVSRVYSEMTDGLFLSTMRGYQVEAFLKLMGMKAPEEPGPRDWSPRTDPRYCRKAGP